MISLNLKSLIQRLNPICREELENAAGYALLKTHYDVEVEHWLKKLLVNDQSDIPEILRSFDVNVAELNVALDRIIDKFRVGNSRAPGLSPTLVDLIKQSWLLSSIEMSSGTIRSGHVFLVALTEERLRLSDSFQDLKKIQLDRLRAEFRKITERSCETNLTSSRLETGSDAPASDAKPAFRLPGSERRIILRCCFCWCSCCCGGRCARERLMLRQLLTASEPKPRRQRKSPAQRCSCVCASTSVCCVPLPPFAAAAVACARTRRSCSLRFATPQKPVANMKPSIAAPRAKPAGARRVSARRSTGDQGEASADGSGGARMSVKRASGERARRKSV